MSSSVWVFLGLRVSDLGPLIKPSNRVISVGVLEVLGFG